MAIVIKRHIEDDFKQRILENADKKCQCRHHRNRTVGVNKSSSFVTSPESDLWDEDNVRVFCATCITEGHHVHLVLPIKKLSDITKRFNYSA